MEPKRKTFQKLPAKVKPKPIPAITLTGQPHPAQQTWWSQRFIEVLESFKLGSRLARGKTYAQEGKVLKIALTNGLVQAAVQGSRKASYRVSIKLEPLNDSAWRMVLQNLTRKAIYASEMLMDRMPTDIESVFEMAHCSLFPARLDDLRSECDCPDWSNPCKHIAATYYVLAQHFDLDPFLIFIWRGRHKTQILESFRTYWKQGRPRGVPAQAPTRVPLDQDGLMRYWQINGDPGNGAALDPFSKSVPDSAIRQLGVCPIQLNGQDLGEFLAEAYQETSDQIRGWTASVLIAPKPVSA
ncbi:MAG: SWIM zinc finger family protein [Acidobacteria bacterium]|nr:SWIM zinc finger family protein [Acidobacteriota bacterium]